MYHNNKTKTENMTHISKENKSSLSPNNINNNETTFPEDDVDLIEVLNSKFSTEHLTSLNKDQTFFSRKKFINSYFRYFDHNFHLEELSNNDGILLKENYLTHLSESEQIDVQNSYNTLDVSNKSLRHIFSLFVYISCFLSYEEMLSFKIKLIENNNEKEYIELCHQQILTLNDKNHFIFHLMLNPFVFKNKDLNNFYITRAYKKLNKENVKNSKSVKENFDFLHSFIKPLFNGMVSDFVLIHMMNVDNNIHTANHIADEIKEYLGLEKLTQYINEDLIFESTYKTILKSSQIFEEIHYAYIKSLSIGKIKKLGVIIKNDTIDQLYQNYKNKHLNYYKTTALYACKQFFDYQVGDNKKNIYTNENLGIKLGEKTNSEKLKIYHLQCFDLVYSAKSINEVNSLQSFLEKHISKELFFHNNIKNNELSNTKFIDFIEEKYKTLNKENIFIELSRYYSIYHSLSFIYKLNMNNFKILDTTKKEDLFIFDQDIYYSKKEEINTKIDLLIHKNKYDIEDYFYCNILIDFFNSYYFIQQNKDDSFNYSNFVINLFNLSQKMNLVRIKENIINVMDSFNNEEEINIKSFKVDPNYGLEEIYLINILPYKSTDIENIIQNNFNIKNFSALYYNKIRDNFTNIYLKKIKLKNENDALRILNIIDPNSTNFDIKEDDLLSSLCLILMFLKEKKGHVKQKLIKKIFYIIEQLPYVLINTILSTLKKDLDYHFFFDYNEFETNPNLNIFKPKYLNKINDGSFVYKFNFDQNESEYILDFNFVSHLLNIEKQKDKLKKIKKSFENSIKTNEQISLIDKVNILDKRILLETPTSEVISTKTLENYVEKSSKNILNYTLYQKEIMKLTEKYPIYKNLIEDMLMSFNHKNKNRKLVQIPRLIIGETIGLKELMKDIGSIILNKTIRLNFEDFSTQSDIDGISSYWANSYFGSIFKLALNSDIINNVFLLENTFIQESNSLSNSNNLLNTDNINFLFNDDRIFFDKKAPDLELDMSYFYFIITAKEQNDVSTKYKKLKEITLNNEEENKIITFKSMIFRYIKSLNKEDDIVIHDEFIKYLLNIDESLETKKNKVMEIINDELYLNSSIVLTVEKYEKKYHSEILGDNEVYIFSKKELLRKRETFLKQNLKYGFDFCGNVINKGFAKKLILADDFLKEVETIGHEYPNFKEVTKYICDSYIVSKLLNNPFYIKPILLAGPPGVGKTHYSKRIAKILNLDFNLISCEKVGSSYDIFGSNSVYNGSKEGSIAKFMLEETQNANPIIMFDEIDKIKKDNNVSDDFLLGILEKENSKHFKDLFLSLEIDLSYINIVGTANYLNNISEPIKNRFKIFNIDYLDYNERKTLFKYIFSNMMNDLKLTSIISSEISEEVEEKLVHSFKSTRDIVKILHELLMNVAASNKNKLELIDLPDNINNKKPWDNIF